MRRSLEPVLAEIGEDTGNPTAEQMVETLVADHEAIVRRLREAAVAAGK